MQESQVAQGALIMRWVPVTGANGRTRFEMRWSVAPAARTQAPLAATADHRRHTPAHAA